MIDSDEFDKRKQTLLEYALELRDMGKEQQKNNMFTK